MKKMGPVEAAVRKANPRTLLTVPGGARFEVERLSGDAVCTAPGFLDTRLRYAAWRSSYSSRASSGVRYASFSRRQHWL